MVTFQSTFSCSDNRRSLLTPIYSRANFSSDHVRPSTRERPFSHGGRLAKRRKPRLIYLSASGVILLLLFLPFFRSAARKSAAGWYGSCLPPSSLSDQSSHFPLPIERVTDRNRPNRQTDSTDNIVYSDTVSSSMLSVILFQIPK